MRLIPRIGLNLKPLSTSKRWKMSFEIFFLNKQRKVYSMDDVGFELIDDCLKWVFHWKANVDLTADQLNLKDAEKAQLFLAWQTFDLLRIMIYGFKSYAQYFFLIFSHQTSCLY
eukprot:Pompholyxophrys_punicea_v1_NODE_312_length_2298_cov_5.277307.p3 type:complete len:114 gc:universal NODE_312_length_2298_cov_5.277307:508-167(-)